MDQTQDLLQFIKDKHPELSTDDIMKCIDAISEWIIQEQEKEYTQT